MATLIRSGRINIYAGLRGETKPVGVPNGSQFNEMDTGKWFVFDEENAAWHPMTIPAFADGGGGGGGGSDLVVAHVTVGAEIFESSDPQEITPDKTFEELYAAGANSAVEVSVQVQFDPSQPPFEYGKLFVSYVGVQNMDPSSDTMVLMYNCSVSGLGNITVAISNNPAMVGVQSGAIIMVEGEGGGGGDDSYYNVKSDYNISISGDYSSTWSVNAISSPDGYHQSASDIFADLNTIVFNESGKHRVYLTMLSYAAPLTGVIPGNFVLNHWWGTNEYNESTGEYDISVRYLWGWTVYNGKLIVVTITGRNANGLSYTNTVAVDSYNLAAEGTTIAHATITNTDFYALPDFGASITIDKTWAELYAANDSIIELTLTNSDRDYKIPLRKMESESPGYDPNGAIEYVGMVPANFTNYRYSYLKDEFSDLWLISVRVDEGSTTSATIRTRKYYSQPLIIGISAQATLESGTRYYANKTAAEIRNAFDLGREIWFDFNTTLYTGKVLATGMHLNSSYNNRRTIKAWFHSYTKCIEIDLIVEDNSTNVGVAIYSAQQQLDLDYS